MAAGMISCQNEKPVKEYPMFWTWLDYRPGMDFESVCRLMNDVGIDGVMLNAPTPDDYREAIPIAHRYGIEVYAWLWTMNLDAALNNEPMASHCSPSTRSALYGDVLSGWDAAVAYAKK